MRHESRRRDRIRVTAFVESAEVPQTGAAVTCTLLRVADSKFWDGDSWEAASTDLAMAELSAAGAPGVYVFSLPEAGHDMALGSDGYVAVVECAAPAFSDSVFIEPVDAPSEEPLDAEGAPSAVEPLARLVVQPGTDAAVGLMVATDPPVSGRAGAWTLREMVLSVGDLAADVNDLADDGFSVPQFVEQAAATPGGHSTPVTDEPTFVAGGGPDDEDVYSIPVSDSSGFSAGDFVRAAGRPQAEAHVYEVLSVPDGTHVLVHAAEDDFGVSDGYTLEQVDPTGVYFGSVLIPVDDYLSVDDPRATLRVVCTTVVSGDGPAWQSTATLSWVRTLELDVRGRTYVAG